MAAKLPTAVDSPRETNIPFGSNLNGFTSLLIRRPSIFRASHVAC